MTSSTATPSYAVKTQRNLFDGCPTTTAFNTLRQLRLRAGGWQRPRNLKAPVRDQASLRFRVPSQTLSYPENGPVALLIKCRLSVREFSLSRPSFAVSAAAPRHCTPMLGLFQAPALHRQFLISLLLFRRTNSGLGHSPPFFYLRFHNFCVHWQ